MRWATKWGTDGNDLTVCHARPLCGCQLAQEVAAMQSEVEGATGITDAAEGRQRECAQKVAELERQINDFGRERERRLKELEKRIKGCRLEAAAALKDLKVGCRGRDVLMHS